MIRAISICRLTLRSSRDPLPCWQHFFAPRFKFHVEFEFALVTPHHEEAQQLWPSAGDDSLGLITMTFFVGISKTDAGYGVLRARSDSSSARRAANSDGWVTKPTWPPANSLTPMPKRSASTRLGR
jgi:hypothetical protein